MADNTVSATPSVRGRRVTATAAIVRTTPGAEGKLPASIVAARATKNPDSVFQPVSIANPARLVNPSAPVIRAADPKAKPDLAALRSMAASMMAGVNAAPPSAPTAPMTTSQAREPSPVPAPVVVKGESAVLSSTEPVAKENVAVERGKAEQDDNEHGTKTNRIHRPGAVIRSSGKEAPRPPASTAATAPSNTALQPVIGRDNVHANSAPTIVRTPPRAVAWQDETTQTPPERPPVIRGQENNESPPAHMMALRERFEAAKAELRTPGKTPSRPDGAAFSLPLVSDGIPIVGGPLIDVEAAVIVARHNPARLAGAGVAEPIRDEAARRLAREQHAARRAPAVTTEAVDPRAEDVEGPAREPSRTTQRALDAARRREENARVALVREAHERAVQEARQRRAATAMAGTVVEPIAGDAATGERPAANDVERIKASMRNHRSRDVPQAVTTSAPAPAPAPRIIHGSASERTGRSVGASTRSRVRKPKAAAKPAPAAAPAPTPAPALTAAPITEARDVLDLSDDDKPSAGAHLDAAMGVRTEAPARDGDSDDSFDRMLAQQAAPAPAATTTTTAPTSERATDVSAPLQAAHATAAAAPRKRPATKRVAAPAPAPAPVLPEVEKPSKKMPISRDEARAYMERKRIERLEAARHEADRQRASDAHRAEQLRALDDLRAKQRELQRLAHPEEPVADPAPAPAPRDEVAAAAPSVTASSRPGKRRPVFRPAKDEIVPLEERARRQRQFAAEVRANRAAIHDAMNDAGSEAPPARSERPRDRPSLAALDTEPVVDSASEPSALSSPKERMETRPAAPPPVSAVPATAPRPQDRAADERLEALRRSAAGLQARMAQMNPALLARVPKAMVDSMVRTMGDTALLRGRALVRDGDRERSHSISPPARSPRVQMERREPAIDVTDYLEFGSNPGYSPRAHSPPVEHSEHLSPQPDPVTLLAVATAEDSVHVMAPLDTSSDVSYVGYTAPRDADGDSSINIPMDPRAIGATATATESRDPRAAARAEIDEWAMASRARKTTAYLHRDQEHDDVEEPALPPMAPELIVAQRPAAGDPLSVVNLLMNTFALAPSGAKPEPVLLPPAPTISAPSAQANPMVEPAVQIDARPVEAPASPAPVVRPVSPLVLPVVSPPSPVRPAPAPAVVESPEPGEPVAVQASPNISAQSPPREAAPAASTSIVAADKAPAVEAEYDPLLGYSPPRPRFTAPARDPHAPVDDRLSPASLQRLLVTEVARLEVVEESRLQLAEYEQAMALNQAQAEVVSIVQAARQVEAENTALKAVAESSTAHKPPPETSPAALDASHATQPRSVDEESVERPKVEAREPRRSETRSDPPADESALVGRVQEDAKQHAADMVRLLDRREAALDEQTRARLAVIERSTDMTDGQRQTEQRTTLMRAAEQRADIERLRAEARRDTLRGLLTAQDQSQAIAAMEASTRALRLQAGLTEIAPADHRARSDSYSRERTPERTPFQRSPERSPDRFEDIVERVPDFSTLPERSPEALYKRDDQRDHVQVDMRDEPRPVRATAAEEPARPAVATPPQPRAPSPPRAKSPARPKTPPRAKSPEPVEVEELSEHLPSPHESPRQPSPREPSPRDEQRDPQNDQRLAALYRILQRKEDDLYDVRQEEETEESLAEEDQLVDEIAAVKKMIQSLRDKGARTPPPEDENVPEHHDAVRDSPRDAPHSPRAQLPSTQQAAGSASPAKSPAKGSLEPLNTSASVQEEIASVRDESIHEDLPPSVVASPAKPAPASPIKAAATPVSSVTAPKPSSPPASEVPDEVASFVDDFESESAPGSPARGAPQPTAASPSRTAPSPGSPGKPAAPGSPAASAVDEAIEEVISFEPESPVRTPLQPAVSAPSPAAVPAVAVSPVKQPVARPESPPAEDVIDEVIAEGEGCGPTVTVAPSTPAQPAAGPTTPAPASPAVKPAAQLQVTAREPSRAFLTAESPNASTEEPDAIEELIEEMIDDGVSNGSFDHYTSPKPATTPFTAPPTAGAVVSPGGVAGTPATGSPLPPLGPLKPASPAAAAVDDEIDWDAHESEPHSPAHDAARPGSTGEADEPAYAEAFESGSTSGHEPIAEDIPHVESDGEGEVNLSVELPGLKSAPQSPAVKGSPAVAVESPVKPPAKEVPGSTPKRLDASFGDEVPEDIPEDIVGHESTEPAGIPAVTAAAPRETETPVKSVSQPQVATPSPEIPSMVTSPVKQPEPSPAKAPTVPVASPMVAEPVEEDIPEEILPADTETSAHGAETDVLHSPAREEAPHMGPAQIDVRSPTNISGPVPSSPLSVSPSVPAKPPKGVNAPVNVLPSKLPLGLGIDEPDEPADLDESLPDDLLADAPPTAEALRDRRADEAVEGLLGALLASEVGAMRETANRRRERWLKQHPPLPAIDATMEHVHELAGFLLEHVEPVAPGAARVMVPFDILDRLPPPLEEDAHGAQAAFNRMVLDAVNEQLAKAQPAARMPWVRADQAAPPSTSRAAILKAVEAQFEKRRVQPAEDHIDELIKHTLRGEEAGWVSLATDEAQVKTEVAELLFDELLGDTVQTLAQIHAMRVDRRRR